MIFAAAVIVLLIAHALRAARHALLFPVRERPRTLLLLIGLSTAYVVNAILPFRVGEAARAFYIAVRANQSLGRVAATIVAERFADLVTVATLFFVLPWLIGLPPLLSRGSALAMLLAVAAIAVAAIAIRMSPAVRRAVWIGASLFNDGVRLAIADLAWCATRLIAGRVLLGGRFLALSAAMWGAYAASYLLLARATGTDPAMVVQAMLGSPLRPLAAVSMADPLVLFATGAALVVLVGGLVIDGGNAQRAISRAIRFGLAPSDPADVLPGAGFINRDDYDATLGAHFGGRDPAVAGLGTQGLGGAIVHRILPGGSSAVTAVVEQDERFSIRKFAVGEAAAKLAEQAEWLRANRAMLPLADVVGEHRDSGGFRYDMPYIASARDLYEYVHTAPMAGARATFDAVLQTVAAWHDARAAGDADTAAIDAYVATKIVANAHAALDFARHRLPDRFTINGEHFALSDWDCLTDPAWAAAQIVSRRTSAIHGDLTIENIVVAPDCAPGWYLIDPNGGNLFDTPLIDWAKLMQSLNLGYETLARGAPARVHEGAVEVIFARSRAYAELHVAYDAFLAGRFDAVERREIAFHEIVNYLRLIPYKIRRQPALALTFFAAASILLRQYRAGQDA